MHRFRRVSAVSLMSLLACSSLAQEPIARVEITSYKQLSADVMSLGMHVQNPMMNMGLMALGNFVGAPGLLGLDQERPIRLALFADGGDIEKAERVLVLPVLEDGAKYLEALKANYTSVSDDGNVRRFRANRNVQSFREMSVAIINGYAVVTPSKPLLDRVAGWIKEAPDHLAVGGIAGSVLVSVDAGAVLPAVRKRLDEQARAADAGGDVGPQTAVADMMRVYADGAIGILEQTLSLKLALQCNEQGLTVYGRIDALPDTTLAKMCAEAHAPSARLRKLLPADATMVYASGAMGALMRHAKDPYLAFARKMMDAQQRMMAQIGAGNLGPEFDMEKLFKQSEQLLDAYGDDLVFSVGPGAKDEPSVLFEAITVKDGAKLLGYMDENFETIGGMYASMGMPLRIVKRTGRTVDVAQVRVYAAEIVAPEPKAKPEAPVAEPAAAGGDEGKAEDKGDVQAMMAEQMATQMAWLTKGVMEMAIVDDVLLVTMGAPGALDPFIAKVRNPPEDASTKRSQDLFPDLKNHDKAVELWNLQLLGFVKSLAPLMDPEGAMKDALAQLPDDGLGLGGLSMTSSTAAMGAFRISATQLGAVVRSVQTLQRLGMQANGGGRPPEAPVGKPVEVVIPED
jgi:hypothetical protein